MTNRNAYRGKLVLFLVALVVLAGVHTGLSESQDIEQLRQAAEQGGAEAQNALGRAYDEGQGVAEDHVKAIAWINLAAAQGHTSAVENKGLLPQILTDEQMAEAEKLADEFRKRIEAAKPE